MLYFDGEEELRRLNGLNIMRNNNHTVPAFGRVDYLAGLFPGDTKIVLFSKPLHLTTIGEAMTMYSERFCSLYVGPKDETGGVCRKMIQICSHRFCVEYYNDSGWKADDGIIKDMWRVGEDVRVPSLRAKTYSFDVINRYAVNFRINVGVRSNHISGLIDRRAIARMIKGIG